jgi:hypothetical protein
MLASAGPTASEQPLALQASGTDFGKRHLVLIGTDAHQTPAFVRPLLF